MADKICFVVMGYGKKLDLRTFRTVDLDESYERIIQPALENTPYQCVRSDYIIETGIIDKSMYELLYKADVVIVDLTTLNVNAVYELGVRHALRAYSTILIQEAPLDLPFDFNHNRTLTYTRGPDGIEPEEAQRCRDRLRALIDAIERASKHNTDSPVFYMLPELSSNCSPSPDPLRMQISTARNNPQSPYALKQQALKEMKEARGAQCGERFEKAAQIWERLHKSDPRESYYIQQWALCQYKSGRYQGDIASIGAMNKALRILDKIKDQIDSETCGIRGAVLKNLWYKVDEIHFLKEALDSYCKGWLLWNDYYTGENYAHCLLALADVAQDTYRKGFLVYGALEVLKKIRTQLEKEALDAQPMATRKWKYATLAHCCSAWGDLKKASEYDRKFRECEPDQWNIKTYETNGKIFYDRTQSQTALSEPVKERESQYE